MDQWDGNPLSLPAPSSAIVPRENSSSNLRCRERIDAAKAQLRPASRRQIAAQLEVLEAIYGPPAGLEQSAGMYLELWSQLPPDVLSDAIKAHIRKSKFFPKPSEILELASEEMIFRREDVDYGCEQLARLDEPRDHPPPPTEQELAERAAQVEEIWGKYGGRPVRIPDARAPIEPLYVSTDVPDTIAGRPWRESDERGETS